MTFVVIRLMVIMKMSVVSFEGKDVCTKCGTIDRYHIIKPTFMFYDRMHLFRSKSSYKLKYYVGV